MTDQDPEKPGEFEDDPEGPPSAEELAEAERLRRALAGELADDEGLPKGAELARALVAAVRPETIDPAKNELLVQRALAKAPKRGGANVLYVAFGVATLAAAAAAAVLGIGSFQHDERGGDAMALAASRPADDLFTEKFPTTGGTSSRVDRIAMARDRDFRDNQFARWGIR